MRFVKEVQGVLEEGKAVVLAVILAKSGSTPRSAGTMMAVAPDGRCFGTIGGGMVESAVIRASLALFGEAMAARVVTYGLSVDDAADAGMVCGGRVSILLHRLDPFCAEQLAVIPRSLKKGRRCVLCLPMERTGLPQVCVVPQDADNRLPPGVTAGLLRRVLRQTTPQQIETPGGNLVALPFADPGTVVITGAGHVAQHTARLTAMAGFRTVVQDDRTDFANRERFPDAHEVQVLPSFDDCYGLLDPGPESYFIVVTRGHHHDKRVLRQALCRPAVYVGMIGSKRKRDACYSALLEEGVPQEDLDRVHCPIGLAIGAETPEEIAVSIVAELIRVRASRRGD
jgi:xanthine dehydrogenase accessory factor